MQSAYKVLIIDNACILIFFEPLTYAGLLPWFLMRINDDIGQQERFFVDWIFKIHLFWMIYEETNQWKNTASHVQGA